MYQLLSGIRIVASDRGFVEIDYDKTETVWGMDIIVNTTAKTDAEAKELLKGFQFPFVN